MPRVLALASAALASAALLGAYLNQAGVAHAVTFNYTSEAALEKVASDDVERQKLGLRHLSGHFEELDSKGRKDLIKATMSVLITRDATGTIEARQLAFELLREAVRIEGAALIDHATFKRSPPTFAYLSLDGIDLSNLDLTGIDFKFASLRGANFENTNLKGANFVGAQLAVANLNGATLDKASFDGANLHAAQLRGAKVRGVNFRFASLAGTDLTDADFTDSVFMATRLHNANITGTNFRGVIGIEMGDLLASFWDRLGASIEDALYASAPQAPKHLEGLDVNALPQVPPLASFGIGSILSNGRADNAVAVQDVVNQISSIFY